MSAIPLSPNVPALAPTPRTTAPAPAKRAYHVAADRPPLGRGAYGTVYHGHDKHTQEQFAVKLIQKDRLKRSDLAACRNEADVMRKAGVHPHLLRLIDVGEDTKNIYVVSPVVKGGDLAQALERGDRYTEGQARDLLRNLLSAIAHLHERGVMHRDIKAENVLLHPPTGTDEVSTDPVLMDFGLATQSATSTMFCGTPYYVAPEVIAAGRDKFKLTRYGPSCDMWSVGVLAYMLLNDATKPFMGTDMPACFEAVTRNEPAWPLPCSADGEAFVRALLVSDPAKRLTATAALDHPWLSAPLRYGMSIEHANSSTVSYLMPTPCHSERCLAPCGSTPLNLALSGSGVRSPFATPLVGADADRVGFDSLTAE